MTSLFGNPFGNRGKAEEEAQKAPNPPPVHISPRPTAITQQPLGFETVLGPSSILEGKLKSDGNLRLDGTFTGTLEISGNVLVGETANIYADIDGQNISIAGAVRGNVTGNKVQLLRSGRVWGDITATTLTTEEGAFIDGKISMRTTEPAPAAPPVAITPAPVSTDDAPPESAPEDAAPPTDADADDDRPEDSISTTAEETATATADQADQNEDEDEQDEKKEKDE
ncbi:MAG: polymer-forming cytoskeletal protein [Anaerolineaceae bacterium]|nr:MAG: polymer-forming cytoskeletal protein [Anaerolineaceae bacterium]